MSVVAYHYCWNMKNKENLIWTLNSYFLRNGPQFNLIIYKNNPNNQVPYSREQKHVSVSDMSWPFQIAYEVDFRSLCTVTFLRKVDFLINNAHQNSQLYGTKNKKKDTQQRLQQFCLVIEKFRKLRLHPETKWKGRNSLEILYHDTDKSRVIGILFKQSILFIDFFFENQFHSQISRYVLSMDY